MKGSRASPRIWDTDWLILRGLARLLKEQARAHVGPDTLMVDLGCGDMPYAGMMRQMRIDYRGADIDDGASLRIDQHGRVPLADGSAGAVLSVQVLEHVRDLDAYCAEITGCCVTMACAAVHAWHLALPSSPGRSSPLETNRPDCRFSDRGLVVEHVKAIVGPLATTTLIR